MQNSQHHFLVILLFIFFTTSCAPTKTLNVWKNDDYTQRLHKVLVITAADQDYMRNMFENIISESLKSRNVQAIPSHKVLPQLRPPLDREAILGKARELGAESIMLLRSVKKEKVTNYKYGGVGYHAVYVKGDNFSFYGFGFGPALNAYNSESFNVLTNIYAVDNEKIIWSTLSETWVQNSKEAVVEPFVAMMMKQLEKGKLIQ